MLPPLPPVTPGSAVPPFVHVVWVGGPVPEWVRYSWSLWEEAAERDGFTLVRWTDEEVSGHPVTAPLVQVREDYGLSARGLCDLLRVAILWMSGGVYMDSDSVALLPLTRYLDRPAWIGAPREQATLRGRTMNNAALGFPLGHPFLHRIWEAARDALSRGVTNDHFVAGTRVFRQVHSARPDVEVIPGFEETRAPAHLRALHHFDLDLPALREEHPEVPVLHLSLHHGYYDPALVWTPEEAPAR